MIPCFCREEYSWDDFLSYPQHEGWDMDDIFDPEFWVDFDETESDNGITEGTALDFIQSWLFFGLLRLTFDNLARFEDFVDQDSGGTTVIHTKNLLKVAEHHAAQPKKMDRFDHIVDCLQTASSVYNTLVVAGSLDPMFLLSIGLTLDFVCSYNQRLYDPSGFRIESISKDPFTREQPGMAEFEDSDKLVPFLTSEMVSSGWCPNAAARMSRSRLSLSTKYVASTLSPPDIMKDHGKCTKNACQANMICKETYKHQHAEAECNCDLVHVDMSQLCGILDKGSIPVVKPSNIQASGRPLQLEESTKETNYVAISHVWSDGLGNPKANAVAGCQLSTIFRAVKELPGCDGTTAIWLDTLCCPVEPAEEQKEMKEQQSLMRKKAIVKMRETYAQAKSVLVLDSQLRAFSFDDLSPLELTVRMFCSGWMSRLWTWQEGLLAKELYFQFSNGLHCINKPLVLAHGNRHRPYEVDQLDTTKLWMAIRGDNMSSDERETHAYSVFNIAHSLVDRTTSYMKDEALCIGSMAGCDVSRILDAPGELRMCAFWKNCPVIPQDIMFWRGQRLEEPGFRWAPATLLQGGGSELQDFEENNRTGVLLDEKGLLIEATAILLPNVLDAPLYRTFFVRDGGGNYICLATREVNDTESTPEVTVSNYTSMAILFDPATDFNDSNRITGVLVYVHGEDEGIVCARRGNTVDVAMPRYTAFNATVEMFEEQMNEDAEKHKVVHRGLNTLFDGEYQAIEGRVLSESQYWIID